jgi:hypothetical protein
MKTIKILAVASVGGHWKQLLSIAFDVRKAFYSPRRLRNSSVRARNCLSLNLTKRLSEVSSSNSSNYCSSMAAKVPNLPCGKQVSQRHGIGLLAKFHRRLQVRLDILLYYDMLKQIISQYFYPIPKVRSRECNCTMG